MVELIIPETELYDSRKNEFIHVNEQKLLLEHSLLSISKWESKYQRPFLDQKGKSLEESRYYVKCMTLNRNVDDTVYLCLTNDHIKAINKYVDNPMSATKPKKLNNRPSAEPVTSELIYYWMIALNIPFECQKWHFNRLMTLIEVCNIKNTPTKKMTAAQRRALNNERKARLHTRG